MCGENTRAKKREGMAGGETGKEPSKWWMESLIRSGLFPKESSGDSTADGPGREPREGNF